MNAADILEFLFHGHICPRNLILEHCGLGKDTIGLLANIVDLYPDLDGLSLKDCTHLTFDCYVLIPRLKKLSDLDLSYCQVDYMYGKLLETHVCICECV